MKAVQSGKPAAHAVQVALESSFDLGKAELRAKYTVHNGSDRTIYLFNRLVRMAPDGSGAVDAKLAYVTFGPDRSAVVSKRLHDVPEGLQVTQREVPYMTRLPAGQRFGDELALELPLSEHHPYLAMARAARPGGPPEVREGTTSSLQLELGYIVARDGIQETHFEEGGETLYVLQGLDPYTEQQIARGAKVSLSAPAVFPGE